MVHRAIAFVHALRLHLRSQSDDALLQRWLPAQDWPAWLSPAYGRGDHAGLGQDLRQCLREGRIDPCLAAGIDTTLSAVTASAASCERIRNTPVPFSYTLLLHRTALPLLLFAAFGLVDTTGFMTPFVVAIVAYTFFGLDALGDEISLLVLESNDLPLDTCAGPSKSTCVSPWVKLICHPIVAGGLLADLKERSLPVLKGANKSPLQWAFQFSAVGGFHPLAGLCRHHKNRVPGAALGAQGGNRNIVEAWRSGTALQYGCACGHTDHWFATPDRVQLRQPLRKRRSAVRRVPAPGTRWEWPP